LASLTRDALVEKINTVVRPLRRRVTGMILRGLVDIVDDAEGVQNVQVKLMAKQLANAERFQEFGFSSNPPKESEVVVLFVSSNQDHPIIVASNNAEHRPKDLAEGDSCLFDAHGNIIKLTENGIEITTNGTMTIDGEVEVTGELTANGVKVSDHTHDYTTPIHGGPTGPTSGPS